LNTIDFLIFSLGFNRATAGYKAPDMGYIQFFSENSFIVVWNASGDFDKNFHSPGIYFKSRALSGSKDLYMLVNNFSLPSDAALW